MTFFIPGSPNEQIQSWINMQNDWSELMLDFVSPASLWSDAVQCDSAHVSQWFPHTVCSSVCGLAAGQSWSTAALVVERSALVQLAGRASRLWRGFCRFHSLMDGSVEHLLAYASVFTASFTPDVPLREKQIIPSPICMISELQMRLYFAHL